MERIEGQPVRPAEVRLLDGPKRQVDHIDILFTAEVRGRKAVFVIEDKTDTSQHSGQLERYKDAVSGTANETVLVYFKTGYHFGSDKDAAKLGYTVIGLKEWVAFLKEYSVTNGEALFHRVDARNDANGKRRYYLSIRQYSAVKGNNEARAAKLRLLHSQRTLFKRAVEESRSGLIFSKPAGDHQGANESEIGILFFDSENNSVQAVLERFPSVHRAFVALLRESDTKAQTNGEASS